MTFPDILQYLNILKTSTSIRYSIKYILLYLSGAFISIENHSADYLVTCRLAQLISIFVSVWLTAAGIIHLVSQQTWKGGWWVVVHGIQQLQEHD